MKVSRRILYVGSIIIFIAGMFTTNLFGEAIKKPAVDKPVVTLDMIEVTAERIAEYVKNHPHDVTVVERKEIEKGNLISVEEVLNTMPGVEVRQSGGSGVRISIRGSGKSSGVLVLVNGRPLNTNQYGSLDLNAIPVDMIQSVTIFKPPVPVWLGPGATEGAINIVTRDLTTGREEKKPSPSKIMVAGGSFERYEGSISHLLPLAGGSTLLTATGAHKEGKRVNSDKNDGNFSVYWNREGRNATKYEVNARYYTAEYGSAGPTDNPTPDARQRYRKGSLDTRIAGYIGENGTYTLAPYSDLTTLKDRSQSGFTSSLDDVKAGIKSEVSWAEQKGLWEFRLGGIIERDDIDHSMTGKHHRTMGDLSIQYDRRFGSATGTLGIRNNYTSDFGYNPGFSGGVSYAISDSVLVRAKTGYSVNVPNFGQLYQTSHGSIDQTKGNPDLKEEKVWSYDIGIEYTLGKERFFQTTLFRSDTRDLISTERGTDLIYRPVNIGSAWRHGIEFTAKYRWDTGLTTEASCIVQRSENRDTGEDLSYTPEITAKLVLRYTVPGFQTRLEGTARYEGNRFSRGTGGVEQRLDSYTTTDIKIIQPFSLKKTAVEWFLRVDNIFGTPFQVHYNYPDDGIRFLSGITMRF